MCWEEGIHLTCKIQNNIVAETRETPANKITRVNKMADRRDGAPECVDQIEVAQTKSSGRVSSWETNLLLTLDSPAHEQCSLCKVICDLLRRKSARRSGIIHVKPRLSPTAPSLFS